ncbi:MAG: hypothetical protein IPK82_00855 [Polyangiaceae bacterium]|nr:hypothetical protein [Polyangiaceae bacterium]
MGSDHTAYLMTAGLSSDDYRFLGRAPKEAFWRRYADYTSFERPSAVVFCKDGAFRAYLSGIASARKDRTKTPLRYTLVMEGQARTPAAESLLFALAAFVGDLVHVKPGPLSPASLGEALDKTFPEEFVEAALSHLRDTDSKDTGPLAEVESRIEKAIAALPRDTHAADCHVRFFCGGRASESARATLVGYAERLLIDGEAGTILIVNLASREHLELMGGTEPSCGVLFAGESGEEAHSDPLEWPPKKGFPGSPKGLPRAFALREVQAEPGLSIPHLGRIILRALRSVRDFFLGRRPANS